MFSLTKVPALFAKYGSRSLESLTTEDLVEIASALGHSITPAQVAGFAEFIGPDGADKLSAWIGVPDNVRRLQKFLKPASAEAVTICCPHCRSFFMLDYE